MIDLSNQRRLELGLMPLTITFTLAADVLITFGAVLFLLASPEHPRLWLMSIAWLMLGAGTVTFQAHAYRRHWQPHQYAPLVYCSVLAAVIVLSTLATWQTYVFPTAVVITGSALLVVITTIGPVVAASAMGVIGTIIVIHAFSYEHDSFVSWASTIAALGMALIPPLAALTVTKSLRRMIAHELDRAKAEATAKAPALSAGLLSSDELAQLDLDTERLLLGIGESRYQLPLPDHLASSAAALATRLRLNLVDGHRETWLHHALNESTILGPAVTLDDRDCLAGSLNSQQRNSLLAAVWLLVEGQQRQSAPLEITFTASNAPDQAPSVIIDIRAEGVRQSRVDPEAWSAVVAIGRHVATIPGKVLHVEIECEFDSTGEVDHVT